MTIARAIRLLLSLVAILIVVWAFFDVGHRVVNQHLDERATADAGQQKITLTLLHWGDKAEDVIVDDLIHRYEHEHPHVHILRVNPGYNDFRPKLKTMMAAGTPPDIFYLPPDIFAELANLQLIRPIDDYVERERAAGQAGYIDDFWPILMKAWHYDVDSGQVGKGKLYGLPKDF